MNLRFALQYAVLGLATAVSLSFMFSPQPTATNKYKCMIQLTNYTGEGAYIVVSVVDKENKYLKTLRVLGEDTEWYPDLPSWWKHQEQNDQAALDAITGATIAGGERTIFVLEIDDALIDAGNELRFETAVEHQKYVEKDLQVPLTTPSLNGKMEGTEYIRYVRIIPN